jgi:hypothetical protein
MKKLGKEIVIFGNVFELYRMTTRPYEGLYKIIKS